MPEIAEHLVELLVILVAAKVGSEAMVRLRQPPVVGELVMGMIVGAGVLGWVRPDGLVNTLAEIGVILLLFEVGLQTELRELVRIGPSAAAVALIGVVVPFALGYGAARALGLGGGDPGPAIFVGAAMTATSVGITARIFADLRRLDSPEAKTIIGAAVIDDVLGLIILAVVVGLLATGSFGAAGLAWISFKAVAFLVGAVALGVVAVPPLFRMVERLRVEGSFVVAAFAFALALSLAAELLAGLAPIVGAFAAGLVLARAPVVDRVRSEIRPIAFLFIPIFFLSIGASVDVRVLAEPGTLLAGGVIAVLAMVGKLGAGLGALGGGIDRWVVGVGMIPRGEVGLIFAAIGLREALVGPEEQAVVVMMVVVTTLVAPIALNAMLRRRDGLPSGPEERVRQIVERATLEGQEVDERGG